MKSFRRNIRYLSACRLSEWETRKENSLWISTSGGSRLFSFSKQMILQARMQLWLSAWKDQSIFYARFNRTQAFRRHAWWIYALFIYSALMIPLCHRHLRCWRAIPWLATMLFATVIVVGHNLPVIERIVQPGSQAYVNDYIYIEDPDWNMTAPGDATRIVAYEKQSWTSGYRAVAFMEGSVRMLKEDDLLT